MPGHARAMLQGAHRQEFTTHLEVLSSQTSDQIDETSVGRIGEAAEEAGDPAFHARMD